MLLGAERPFNIDVANGRGHTPLHAAARTGCADAVRMLCDAGANVRARTASRKTARKYAATDEVAALLRAYETKRSDPPAPDGPSGANKRQ